MRCMEFSAVASSANISQYAGQSFDEMFIAAGDARKWYANQNEQSDLQHINRLFEDVRKIGAERVYILSTVDVYGNRVGNEAALPDEISCEPYGRHRFMFEQALAEHYSSLTIVRLPGLFGPGLKKNIIFDLMHGRALDGVAANATFQWFSLFDLKMVLDQVRQHDIKNLNVCSEPISVMELVNFLGISAEYDLKASPSATSYDITSVHASVFGGDAYLFDKEYILTEIKKFFLEFKKEK